MVLVVDEHRRAKLLRNPGYLYPANSKFSSAASEIATEDFLDQTRIRVKVGTLPPIEITQISLSDSFPVAEPAYNLEQLLQTAKDQNPALLALEDRRKAASVGVTSAKTAFLPSLSARAGWGGFTQQLTNDGLLLNQYLQRLSAAIPARRSNWHWSRRTTAGRPIPTTSSRPLISLSTATRLRCSASLRNRSSCAFMA